MYNWSLRTGYGKLTLIVLTSYNLSIHIIQIILFLYPDKFIHFNTPYFVIKSNKFCYRILQLYYFKALLIDVIKYVTYMLLVRTRIEH